jgi:hypothetical protein
MDGNLGPAIVPFCTQTQEKKKKVQGLNKSYICQKKMAEEDIGRSTNRIMSQKNRHGYVTK